MKRNKASTMEKIANAACGIILESGFLNFGVNAVAARSGMDKVLIYRYFGGLDGLLAALAGSETFFPEAAEFKTRLAGKPTPGGLLAAYKQELAQRPLTLQLLRWENILDNPLVTACRQAKEIFQQKVAQMIPAGDWQEMVPAILDGAVQQKIATRRSLTSLLTNESVRSLPSVLIPPVAAASTATKSAAPAKAETKLKKMKLVPDLPPPAPAMPHPAPAARPAAVKPPPPPVIIPPPAPVIKISPPEEDDTLPVELL